MIRPMNEREITLGIVCDVCCELATHCHAETTDYPLFFCNDHAFQQGFIYGGTVRPTLWILTTVATSKLARHSSRNDACQS